MDTQMLIRIVVGVLMIAVVGVFAAKRVLWLTKLIRSGQPTSDREQPQGPPQKRITTQFEEVFGQTRLLRWSIPGLAHFFTMWGFFILATVYLEAFGLLVVHDFHIPFVGRWDAWASCRTSSPSPCCSASSRSRSSASCASPRSTAATPASTARTPAAPG